MIADQLVVRYPWGMSLTLAPNPLMSLEDARHFLVAHFPQVRPGVGMIVEAVGPMTSRLRLVYHDRHLRPGGTIAGPAMFGLADCALYIAILAQIGPVALALTTNLNINFLARPAPADLIADCRLMKLGKRLAVGEVWLRSDGADEPVAHATGTYSIPPRGI